MAVDVLLQTEEGTVKEVLPDDHNVFSKIIDAYGAREDFLMLSFIDIYGDTYFNSRQAPRFMEELRRLKSLSDDPDEQAVISELQRLTTHCLDEMLLLRFLGD